ncbi:MAG TPA: tetratricopeptide repeat protein [Anaerolineales bacterium]|nr:tetratricopeptide repeat protein [Anaerolineales bacterium]
MAPTARPELDTLENSGLVVRGADAPEAEYAFKHSLVQETAYGSLLKNRRAELHREVAEAIEALLPAGDVPAAILALHYREAGIPSRAFPFAVRAGDEAWRTYSHAEALASYDLALQLVPQLPPGALSPLRGLYARRGSILEVLGHHKDAEANYEAMRAEAARLGDPAMEADALNRLATVRVITFGRAEEAWPLLDRAIALAEQAHELPLVARALWNRGLTYRFVDPQQATSFFQKALELMQRPDCQALGPSAGVKELEGHILLDLRVTHMLTGQPRPAAEYGHQAQSVFESLGNRAMVADALGGQAMLAIQRGLPDEGLRLSEQGLEISRSIDNPWGYVYNGWIRLDPLMDRGRLDEVRTRGLQLLEKARGVAFPIFIGAIESILTRLCLHVGDTEAALQHAQSGVTVLVQPSAPVWATWGHGALGLALLGLGRVDEAGRILRPIMDRLQEHGPDFQGYYVAAPAAQDYTLAAGDISSGLSFSDRILSQMDANELVRPAIDVRLGRARLRLAAGRAEEALDDLEQVGVAIEARSILLLLWRCHALRGAALARLGRPEEAASAREQARLAADRLISMVQAEDLRTGLARTVEKFLAETESRT